MNWRGRKCLFVSISTLLSPFHPSISISALSPFPHSPYISSPFPHSLPIFWQPGWSVPFEHIMSSLHHMVDVLNLDRKDGESPQVEQQQEERPLSPASTTHLHLAIPQHHHKQDKSTFKCANHKQLRSSCFKNCNLNAKIAMLHYFRDAVMNFRILCLALLGSNILDLWLYTVDWIFCGILRARFRIAWIMLTEIYMRWLLCLFFCLHPCSGGA